MREKIVSWYKNASRTHRVLAGLSVILVLVGTLVVVINPGKKEDTEPRPVVTCTQVTGIYCEESCEPFHVAHYRPGFWLCPSTDGTFRAYSNPSLDSKETSSRMLADVCECGP